MKEKRLTRNYADPESREWWEAAERAAANAPKIVVAPPKTDFKAEAHPKLNVAQCDPDVNRDNGSK